YNPPTTITAGLTLFRCCVIVRLIQKVSKVLCFAKLSQNFTVWLKYFSFNPDSVGLSKKNLYISFEDSSNPFGPSLSVMGFGRGASKIYIKRKASARNSAPPWWKSSPMNQSVTGACGDTAFRAGCEPIKLAVA